MTRPICACLGANARYHDTDPARLELLKLLAAGAKKAQVGTVEIEISGEPEVS